MKPKKTNRRLDFRTGKLYQTTFYINIGQIDHSGVEEFVNRIRRYTRIPPQYFGNET